MSVCKHEHFFVQANVVRLKAEDEEPEIIVGFRADIKIFCAECHQPFEFMGCQLGISNSRPTTNFDATELSAPIRPSINGAKKESNIIEGKQN